MLGSPPGEGHSWDGRKPWVPPWGMGIGKVLGRGCREHWAGPQIARPSAAQASLALCVEGKKLTAAPCSEDDGVCWPRISTRLFHQRKWTLEHRRNCNLGHAGYSKEKAMAPHSSTLAWKISWTQEPGGLQSMGSRSWTRLSDFTFILHFHALEKEMATHSSVLAWRIPGMGEPGGLPSMGSHRVGHD